MSCKSWRYIFHMEDGRQLCVGQEYVGTEPEAMWEGENRLFEHEHGGGETPVSIEVQSQGKPNPSHQPPPNGGRLDGVVALSNQEET